MNSIEFGKNADHIILNIENCLDMFRAKMIISVVRKIFIMRLLRLLIVKKTYLSI